MLKEFGFPSIFIGPANREEYLKAIDYGNEKDYSKIVIFFTSCIFKVSDDLLEKAKDKINYLSENEKLVKCRDKYLQKMLDKLNKIKLTGDYQL
jgi:hypothetical protein